MVRLTDADRRAIADAIVEAEARTDGEIYCVVARESDDYRAVAALWAVLGALLLGPVLLVLDAPAVALVLLQLVAALLLGTLSQWRFVRLALAPRALKRRRAHRTAVEMFLAHNIHATPERTGVLLFVSLAERHAEVVADAGIHAVVPDEVWVELVERLTGRIAAGELAAGLVEAIRAAGDILANHVPPTGARDRLPNTVVEI